MAEGAPLLREYGRNPIEGSNPSLSAMNVLNAHVAQLDRVPGYEPGGRRFESFHARHSCNIFLLAALRPFFRLVMYHMYTPNLYQGQALLKEKSLGIANISEHEIIQYLLPTMRYRTYGLC